MLTIWRIYCIVNFQSLVFELLASKHVTVFFGVLPQRLGYETNIKHYRWWKLKQQTSTISNNSLGGKQLYLKIWFCLQLRPVQSINWRFDVFHTHGGHSCLPDTLEAEEKVYWWWVRNIALNRSTLKTEQDILHLYCLSLFHVCYRFLLLHSFQ